MNCKSSARLVLLVSKWTRIESTNIQTSLQGKRFIFSDTYLKLDTFNRARERIQAQYGDTKTSIQGYLEKQASDSVNSINLNHLVKLLRLSTNQQDIQFLTKYIRLVVQDNSVISGEEKRGYVIELVRLLYVTNNIDKFFELFNDPVLRPFMEGTMASLLILNKLLIEKRFQQVVDIFNELLPHFNSVKSYSSFASVVIKQPIPHDHLECVIEALYNLNSKREFDQLKKLIELLESKKCNLGRSALVRSFILSMNQNEPEFALKLVHATPTNLDLRINLEIIALCNLGWHSKAFILLNQMFNIPCIRYHSLTGKFFPFTLKTVEKKIEESEFADDFRKEFLVLKAKIDKEKRIASIDLGDYGEN